MALKCNIFETKDCLVSLTRGATTVVWIGLVEVNILLLQDIMRMAEIRLSWAFTNLVF